MHHTADTAASAPSDNKAQLSGEDYRRRAMLPTGPVYASMQKLQILRNVFAVGTVVAPVCVGCILAYVQFLLPKDDDKLLVLANTLGWTLGGGAATLVCFLGAWFLDTDTRKFVEINHDIANELDITREKVAIAQRASDLILSDTRQVVNYWSQRYALLERFWTDLNSNLLDRLPDIPPLSREEKTLALEEMLQVFSEKLGKFYAGLNGEGDWHMAIYTPNVDRTECLPVVTRVKNESMSDGQPRIWLRGEGHVGISFQRFERGHPLYHIPDSMDDAVNELVSGVDQSRQQADAMQFRNVLAVPIHDVRSRVVIGIALLACNQANVLKKTDVAPLADLARAASLILSASEPKVELRVDNTSGATSGTVVG